MTKKSSAEYQREYRRRLRDKGLVKKEVWVLPENSKLLHEVEKELRTPISGLESQQLSLETPYSQHVETPTGGHNMHNKNAHRWTTESLYGALKDRPAFSNGSCTIEIIEGLDSSIVIGMHEYGDLSLPLASIPTTLTVTTTTCLAP